MAAALARQNVLSFPVAAPAPARASELGVGTLLEAVATRATVARGASIFHEGDDAGHCYKLLSGTVSLYKLLIDGRRQVMDFLVPGDFFGFAEADIHGYTAEALSDVIVARYPRAAIERLAQSHAALCRWLLHAACRDLTAAQSQVVMLGRKTAMERVASFFLAYAKRLERAGSRCQPLRLPMRRVDIADYLGLTLETVSRTLGALKARGVVELHRHDEITFRNRAALEGLAESA